MIGCYPLLVDGVAHVRRTIVAHSAGAGIERNSVLCMIYSSLRLLNLYHWNRYLGRLGLHILARLDILAEIAHTATFLVNEANQVTMRAALFLASRLRTVLQVIEQAILVNQTAVAAPRVLARTSVLGQRVCINPFQTVSTDARFVA